MIAEDLCSPKAEEQGVRKSWEKASPQGHHSDELDRISSEYSKERFSLGFGIECMASEYRVLRTLVLCRWGRSFEGKDNDRLQEMMRFNESIDQAVQSAIAAYSAEKEQRVRLFRDRFEHEIKHAERTGVPVALPFIDLDHFKGINDTSGHDAGTCCSIRPLNAFRHACTKPTRLRDWGGDEFTVILPNADGVDRIQVVAEKILRELCRPFPLAQQSALVSGSIGITVFPNDADSPTELLRHADQAMYAAKNAGRSRYCFFSAPA